MIYKVVKDFVDLQDRRRIYRAGEIYPRAGLEVSDERVAELASTSNKRGEILIKAMNVERRSAQEAKISPVSDEKKNSEGDIAKKKKAPKKQKKEKK